MHALPGITSGGCTIRLEKKSDAQKQAATRLTPEQIEQVRDACFTGAFPNYPQGRDETIITLLAETGLV